MASCKYCRISAREETRILDYIQDTCLKNPNGACVACQKLAEVEAKIDDARRALERLLDEREELVPSINEHHDPFARTLPLEVASNILNHCRPILPPACTTIRNVEKELTAAVFTPGRVCRNWRKISRSTPELWSGLSVTVTRSNCVSSVKFVSEWLERSKGHPLFIQLVMKNPVDEPQAYCAIARKVLASILRYAERWQVLELDVPPGHDFLPWISATLSDRDVGRLQHVKVGFGEDNDVLRFKASPAGFTQSAGSIRQICLNWDKLCHITLAILYVDEAVKLFRNAPCLLSCKLWEVVGAEDLEPGPIAVSPALRSLVIEGVYPSFWDYFSFPSLDSLHISGPCHDSDDGGCWTRLEALIRRSGCKLHSLIIENDDYPTHEDDVVKVLHATPDLKILSIGGRILDNLLFSRLDAATISKDTMHGFLAKLESLHCLSAKIDLDWSWLVAFLTSLSSHSEQSLQSFEFQYRWKHSAGAYTSALDKITFKNVMDATDGVDFKMVDAKGQDL